MDVYLFNNDFCLTWHYPIIDNPLVLKVFNFHRLECTLNHDLFHEI